MSKVIYLASPYSDADPMVRQERFGAVCLIAATMMHHGLLVYSPIAHTHPIALCCGLPEGFEYYRRFDRAMIERCDELCIAKIDGWAFSAGITAEIEIAREFKKPITFTLDGLRFTAM